MLVLMGVVLIQGLQGPQNHKTLLCVGQQLRECFFACFFPDLKIYLKNVINDNMNVKYIIIKACLISSTQSFKPFSFPSIHISVFVSPASWGFPQVHPCPVSGSAEPMAWGQRTQTLLLAHDVRECRHQHATLVGDLPKERSATRPATQHHGPGHAGPPFTR